MGTRRLMKLMIDVVHCSKAKILSFRGKSLIPSADGHSSTFGPFRSKLGDLVMLMYPSL